jgi:hypothetical protein
MTIHHNSRKAYEEERHNITKRQEDILTTIEMFGPMTDRECLGYMDLPDMNCVRPRITELIDRGLLVQVDSVKCGVTKKTVRRVRLVCPPPKEHKDQMRLFNEESFIDSSEETIKGMGGLN